MIKGDRLVQLAVTPEQSIMLRLILAKVSESNPFVLMDEEYDLVRKSQVETFKEYDNRNLQLGQREINFPS